MKKIAVITLVMIMLVVSAVPAFAKGTGGNGLVSGSSSTCTGPAYGVASGNGNVNGNGSGMMIGMGVRNPYALSGVISALDAQAGTVTVSVVCGNRLVAPYFGQDVTLQTTDYTRFLLRNPDGTATPISFSDLSVGDNISSHGILADGNFTATRITVGALLECLP